MPWPPIDGGKKGTLGFVEQYQRHRSVANHHLLCFCPEEEVGYAEDWRKESPVSLEIEPIDVRNTVRRIIHATLLSELPFNMEKYSRISFERKIVSAVNHVAPDVVHFDSLHTACYSRVVRNNAPGALRVLRCHNAEHVILERFSESEDNPFRRAVINIHARRLRQYEASILDEFDLILAITEADAERFRKMNPRIASRMMVLPAGSDAPSELSPVPVQVGSTIRLIHIAAMDWIPNQGGLRWLFDNVLPLLDQAGLDYHLDVIGKNMPEAFLAFSHPRVTVHGFVKDLQPITSRANLALIPLQVGGGMRVKILDYWAMGIPVIATPVGAEGLAVPGENLMVLAESAPEFASAIHALSLNSDRRDALRKHAFCKLQAKYGWPQLVDGLIARYDQLLSVTRCQ